MVEGEQLLQKRLKPYLIASTPRLYVAHEARFGVTVAIVENGIEDPSSNEGVCFFFHTNILAKTMNQ